MNLTHQAQSAAVLLVLLCVGGLRAAPILPPATSSHVFISSYGTHEIHCFARNGAHLFRFSHPELRQPRGLLFTENGELHAAAQETHKILVFHDDGTYVREYTGGGLTRPTSLALGPDGRIYVASFGTSEVLVFEDDVYQEKFTADGLRGPNCIAFAENGDIYVASQLSNEVYQFTAAGESIRSFQGGGLSSPMGVAVSGEEVFVTGGASHSVVIFDLEGNHLRTVQGSFDDLALSGAQGIAFDATGNFAVSSFYKGRAGLFSRAGELLFLFDDSGMSVARSIAFLRRDEADIFLRGDFNEDATMDVADPVAVLNHLFMASTTGRCLDSGDTNDDGELSITDGIVALQFLFLGAAPPSSPHPNPGTDPTPDEIGCR